MDGDYCSWLVKFEMCRGIYIIIFIEFVLIELGGVDMSVFSL